MFVPSFQVHFLLSADDDLLARTFCAEAFCPEEAGEKDCRNCEKEVLGVYVSGHPMDDYDALWRRHITNVSLDFINEEDNPPKVSEGEKVTIGGIITGKSVKNTSTGKLMAYITLEDVLGAVEVIVFPRDYEKYKDKLLEDNKVFIEGRVNIKEDENGKIVCSSVTAFNEIPRVCWLQFDTGVNINLHKLLQGLSFETRFS